MGWDGVSSDMSVDEDFKEWMKNELKEIKIELSTLRAVSQRNSDTLKSYLWFWRGMRYTLMLLGTLIAFNWKEFLKLLGKG